MREANKGARGVKATKTREMLLNRGCTVADVRTKRGYMAMIEGKELKERVGMERNWSKLKEGTQECSIRMRGERASLCTVRDTLDWEKGSRLRPDLGGATHSEHNVRRQNSRCAAHSDASANDSWGLEASGDPRFSACKNRGESLDAAKQGAGREGSLDVEGREE